MDTPFPRESMNHDGRPLATWAVRFKDNLGCLVWLDLGSDGRPHWTACSSHATRFPTKEQANAAAFVHGCVMGAYAVRITPSDQVLEDV